METFDTFLTYAYDFVLGGGSLYIGAALVVHLVDRWNKLEVKPKVAAPAVNLPLALKAPEAVTLEAKEQPALAAMPASPSRDLQPMPPLEPAISPSLPLPEPELPSAPDAPIPEATREPLDLALPPEPAEEPEEAE